MNINWPLVVEALKALAWPLVAALGLYLLKRPLRELVAQLARRATKVSVFEVSIELATLPELRPSWSVGDVDPRQLTSAQIFDSASQALFEELLKPAQADYAIVDLRSGHAWLNSRLFLFALILGDVTGLRAFVFLETAAGVRRRFLGVASPVAVRRKLGTRYPWLEEAFARALAAQYPLVPQPLLPTASAFSNQQSPLTPGEQWRVTSFVQRFIQELQRSTAPPTQEQSSYLEIGTSPQIWERAQWLDGEHLERGLIGSLDYAWVEYSPDAASASISDAVLRRPVPFVALVDTDRRFLGLVDRGAMLSQTAQRTVASAVAQNSSHLRGTV